MELCKPCRAQNDNLASEKALILFMAANIISITFVEYFNNSNGYNVKVDNVLREILIYSKHGDVIDRIIFGKKLEADIKVCDLFITVSPNPLKSYQVLINTEKKVKYLWFGGPEFVL